MHCQGNGTRAKPEADNYAKETRSCTSGCPEQIRVEAFGACYEITVGEHDIYAVDLLTGPSPSSCTPALQKAYRLGECSWPDTSLISAHLSSLKKKASHTYCWATYRREASAISSLYKVNYKTRTGLRQRIFPIWRGMG